MAIATDETILTGHELDARAARLRAAYWERRHHDARIRIPIAGSGNPTLTGHAVDFCRVLEASAPQIMPDELIVGSALAVPEDPGILDLGYYNPHYPPGHATIMALGLAGIRGRARQRLTGEADPERIDFLRGAELAYDGACRYVARYADAAQALASREADPRRRQELERIAAVCAELATGAPTSFLAGLQLLQFVRVLGGWGCVGRFDQWMYPLYTADLAAGRLTREEAWELLACLFIKMNEFAEATADASESFVSNDDLRNIALAGQTPEGEDACNDLTLLCLEVSAALMLPEPKLNVRLHAGSPRRLVEQCCRLLARGANVLAIFNDDVCIPALERLGIAPADARDFCNDGCSELILGGRSTIHFRVYDALPALTETILEAQEAPYATFDALMTAYKERLTRYMPDGPVPDQAITHPFFAASIADCLDEASPTGVRYSLWGYILAEAANAADGLAAIRRLVYEQRAVSWSDLVSALKNDYEGHEPLRQLIRNRMPKYGNDIDEVDALAKEIAEYYCEGVHARGGNTPGPGPKCAPGLMCFGIHRKRDLPASPDGRRQGDLTATSFSPAVGMDRSGPTAVLRSASKVDLTKASHGSVLDVALHASVFRGEEGMEKLAALIETFRTMPSTGTLQLNVLDQETLRRAKANPHDPEFRTLIVRVWGFSAVFVDLPEGLQDHVLARTAHGA